MVQVSINEDPGWLFSWWKTHSTEYPPMALTARDYLAIPGAEVSVEWLFSSSRELLGLRRYSLTETMRVLTLLKDMYR